ncbi:MAG TPA: hypothetical protein VFB54_05405 [Burkholderiales bacterium]|nr:hypothetical protein [Burkholderiales bacterium]
MSEDPQHRSSSSARPPPLAAFNWKAVAFGLFTDILSTAVLSVVLFSLLGTRLVAEGTAPRDMERALLSSNAYLLVSMIAGLGCTVLGGYVSAWVAGRLEYYHALLTGIAVLIFGELMMLGSPLDYPLAYRVLGNLLLIPAALYGGHLRKVSRTRESQS